MTRTMRFLIVEDHPLFRRALRAVLEATAGETEIFEVASIADAVETIESAGRINLVLLDLHLPGTKDFYGLLELRKRFPRVPIAVVSSLDDPEIVREALRIGASGFIPKSFKKQDFQHVINEILSGDVYAPPCLKQLEDDGSVTERDELLAGLKSLTRRQLTVLQKIREGKPNREIAADLGVRETTVKAHVSDILDKLNAFSRTQLVAIVKRLDFEKVASNSAKPA